MSKPSMNETALQAMLAIIAFSQFIFNKYLIMKISAIVTKISPQITKLS